MAIKFWPRGAECINVDVQRELHHHSGQVLCQHLCHQGKRSLQWFLCMQVEITICSDEGCTVD